MTKSTQKPNKNCILLNKNLIILKIILFFFYGGISLLTTVNNLSLKFNEKQTLLIYGLSSLLSIATPIVFGLFSDKTAQPKKVLSSSLILSALLYPLILSVPPPTTEKHEKNQTTKLTCNSSNSELISTDCGDGCGGVVILKKCQFNCLNEVKEDNLLSNAQPHVCVNNLCYVFDEDMHEVVLNMNSVHGYNDLDGMCHYDMNLVSCSPVFSNCFVVCDVKLENWSCDSDFIQFVITFGSFVAVHCLGGMLLITSSSLLNSAILSMSHEHNESFRCQYIYAALGYGVTPTITKIIFDYFQWDNALITTAAITLLLLPPALLSFLLPYNAEWIPKNQSIKPNLKRWMGRSQMFLIMLIILGIFNCLNQVISFDVNYGSIAIVTPLFIFLFIRIERIIEYCGHFNLFCIGFVVWGMQWAGYAHLFGEWSLILKAMETFSIVLIWISASYSGYHGGPRTLTATIQSIIVTAYCCIGRGLGGLIGFIGLTFLSKQLFLQFLSIFAIFICIFFLFLVHYCFGGVARGRGEFDGDNYTPLKIINGKKNLAKDDEDVNDI